MGCGCGRKGVVRRTATALRPTVGPRSVQGQQAAGASPAQLRVQNAQAAQSPQQAQRLDAQRRRIEKLRRDAIRRRLGR